MPGPLRMLPLAGPPTGTLSPNINPTSTGCTHPSFNTRLQVPSFQSFHFPSHIPITTSSCSILCSYPAMASMAAMKTTLVLMLLLGAVVASHGRSVSCKNSAGVSITVCGTVIPDGATKLVTLAGGAGNQVTYTLKNNLGHSVSGFCNCPDNVSALKLVIELGYLKVKVVGLIKGLVGAVLNLVLCSLYYGY